MKWARWSPGRWHRIQRIYDGVTPPAHPYAPFLTRCGKWMREPDRERDDEPAENVCVECARRAE